MNRFALLGLLVVAGCPTPMVPTDGGTTPEDVPYQGETVGGSIPSRVPRDPLLDEDAGLIQADQRCCNLAFRITDQEGAQVTGRLVGSWGPIAGDGVALRRGTGEWTAFACIPFNAPQSYRYVFSTTAGDDAGVLEDGGTLTTWARASTFEPSEDDGLGGSVNLIPALTECASSDASVGSWP